LTPSPHVRTGSISLVRADTPNISKNPKSFAPKNAMSHWTTPLSPDCGRLLWMAPNQYKTIKSKHEFYGIENTFNALFVNTAGDTAQA